MLTRRTHIGAIGAITLSAIASAQSIDFETLPAGGSTTDQQVISTQYEPDFGVTFDLVDPNTLLPIGSPLIAKVGSPTTAFQGCGPDTPLPGEGVGLSFLTDDSEITNQTGTLLLTYTDPVAQAAGAVLDVDRRPGGAYEEWTIEALDASMTVIDTVVLTAPFGTSECGGSNGSGDARAMGFLFNRANADIHFILIRYTGTAGSIGLAFDNFYPDQIPPAPSATASAASTNQPCYGDAIALTATPTDGLPGYNYQWQKALPLGAFTDIVGETSQVFNAPALPNEISYRAIVTDALFRQTTTNPVTIDSARPLSWSLKIETAPGSGTFTTLTTNITPYVFDETLATVYDWQQSEQYYHGDEPVLQLDRSHMFITVAPGGQSLVVVHDSADPNTGGRAEMSMLFTGATPSFMFRDDPSDTYRGEGTDFLETRHNWSAPNTDGWAAGPLSGSWSAAVQFADGFGGSPTIEGLAEWYFHSADGSAYQLPLEEDRIVLIEATCTPCLADLTNDGALDFFDISVFLSAFSTQDPLADFTGDGDWNFFDVSAFLSAFAEGCP